MARYISILSAKGGTGASTICANLAKSFAQAGNSVLVADLDIGMHTQEILLGMQELVVYNWNDAIENNISAASIPIQHPDYPKLSLLPAPGEILDNFSLTALTDILATYMDEYEYILMDMPTGLGIGSLITRQIADMAMLVTTPEAASINGTKKISDIIGGVCKKPTRLVVNKVSADMLEVNGVVSIDQIIDLTSTQLIGLLPYSININSEPQKKSKSDTPAIFSAIRERLQGNMVPIVLKNLKG